MKARFLALQIVIAALALTASLWAQDGLEGALSVPNFTSATRFGIAFSDTLAAADFDGDSKPDGAILLDPDWRRSQSSFRVIQFHFTARRNSDLIFESTEIPLSISALDVNRDGTPDIVVEQPFTHKRLQVWLNDGYGGFRQGRVEDFPADVNATGHRLDTPSLGPDGPTLGLPAQRGYEFPAFSTIHSLLHLSSSRRQQALSYIAPLGADPVASHSPRAPPLPQAL